MPRNRTDFAMEGLDNMKEYKYNKLMRLTMCSLASTLIARFKSAFLHQVFSFSNVGNTSKVVGAVATTISTTVTSF